MNDSMVGPLDEAYCIGLAENLALIAHLQSCFMVFALGAAARSDGLAL
ncbi:hypothetical protein [Rhodoferax sp.]|nr:hypothetical protein [Rhodoferax sp.]